MGQGDGEIVDQSKHKWDRPPRIVVSREQKHRDQRESAHSVAMEFPANNVKTCFKKKQSSACQGSLQNINHDCSFHQFKITCFSFSILLKIQNLRLLLFEPKIMLVFRCKTFLVLSPSLARLFYSAIFCTYTLASDFHCLSMFLWASFAKAGTNVCELASLLRACFSSGGWLCKSRPNTTRVTEFFDDCCPWKHYHLLHLVLWT